MANSIRSHAKRTADRPQKPYPAFPLTPHHSGKWMKKILGKIHYFGRWGKVVGGKMTRIAGDGWKDALAEYKKDVDDLHGGRNPRPDAEGCTVGDLCNSFLTSKQRKRDAGELSPRTFEEYRQATDKMVAAFSKGRRVDDLVAGDFATYRVALTKRYGPVRVGNEIQKVRTVFKYGIENALVERAVRFGSDFRKPDRKVMRLHRAKVGKRLFTGDEVRALVSKAKGQLRAMVLLGLNCGFANSDCGTLPLARLDLNGGWVEFPRPKTGVERRCPLWPETVAALRAVISTRREPKDSAEQFVFLTKQGNPWASDGASTAVSHEFGKLLRSLAIVRQGVGFYALRHTFRTVADATKDPNAIRLIMGHTDDRIDGNYTHGIDDARLKAVTEHVRAWLFGPNAGTD